MGGVLIHDEPITLARETQELISLSHQNPVLEIEIRGNHPNSITGNGDRKFPQRKVWMLWGEKGGVDAGKSTNVYHSLFLRKWEKQLLREGMLVLRF